MMKSTADTPTAAFPFLFTIKYAAPMTSNTPEKIRNVTEVPTAGIVTNVGIKVPIMLPMVLHAPSLPATLPLSSRSDTVYFISEGVTVPNRNRGNTNMIIHAAKAAHISNPVDMVTIMMPVTSSITYFPTTGMRPIHTAAISIRIKSFDGSGSLSAHFPPKTFPNAIAIIMVPMIMVHTIWDDEK
ncbi:MAG: hypothetical protein BWY61_00675 [Firmicutes bacterium ADurb.Bin354]|nr:MAG: hypothetical protein BWY61_00675 [Firmicutes bacterium ADurb.Bin354]